MHFLITIILAFLGFAQCELIDMTCSRIRNFVNGHNDRRMLLVEGKLPGYPPAADMKLMVWDDELADKAAEWASHNQSSHNPNSSIRSNRYKTGENIFWYKTTDITSSDFDEKMSLENWWDEFKLWQYRKMSEEDFANGSGDIGHFTQMAWAKSDRLGCAISKKIEKDWAKYFIVCNYGPCGNYIGEYPYESGAPSRKLKCTGEECTHLYGRKCS